MTKRRTNIAIGIGLVVVCPLLACGDIPETSDGSQATAELSIHVSVDGPLDPQLGADDERDAGARRAVLAPIAAMLAEEVRTRSPGTELSLGLYDYATHEYAGLSDGVTHVSASSAKVLWVAAALRKVGVAPVAPHARPIFVTSSNDDAARVIDLAVPNAINEFHRLAGMTKSAYTQWQGGHVATNSPRLMGSNNYFTARDGVAFLNTVLRRSLLDPATNARLEEWMTWSPRAGYGGWLGTLLPPRARATMMHKAGWLPPPYAERCVNELGLVDAGGEHWYAIAIFTRFGRDYEAQKAFVEHASCEVYKAVAGAPDLPCE